MIRHTFDIEISVESDLTARINLSYLPGHDADQDCPASASEWDINTIELFKYEGETGLDCTELLLALDFEVQYEDQIQEAADEAYADGAAEPDPDYLRDAARDDKLTGGN